MCCHGCGCTRPAGTGIQEIAGHQKASTLEEIERSQIRHSEAVVGPPADKPLFRQMSGSHVHVQPESPDTMLRRTLNIAAPAPTDTGQQPSPVGSHHLNTFHTVKPAAPPDSAIVTQKPSDTSMVAVLSGTANTVDSSEISYADVASSLSPTNLITPQALLQTHFPAKVS